MQTIRVNSSLHQCQSHIKGIQVNRDKFNANDPGPFQFHPYHNSQ